MQNKSQYKSLEEWRKDKPDDYAIAKKKKYLGDIAEHFGWEKPVSYRLKEEFISNSKELRDNFINNFNDVFLPTFKNEMNECFDKHNKAAGVRLRKLLTDFAIETQKLKSSLHMTDGISEKKRKI